MPTGRRFYIAGDRKFTCAVCGYTSYRLSEMRIGVSGSQKGVIVCPVDFDAVHPRDETVNLRPIPPLRNPV